MARILYTAHTWEAHIRPHEPWIRAQIAQGHDVRLAAPAHLGNVAAEYGVPFVAAGEDWTTDPRYADQVPRLLVTEGNAEFNRVLFTEAFPLTAKGMAQGIMRLADEGWRPDIIMHDLSEDGARMAAELLGVPSVALDNGLARLKFELHPQIKPTLDQIRAELGLPPEPEGQPASFGTVLTPAHPDLLLGDIPGVIGYRHENPVRPGATLPDWVAERGDRDLVYQMLGRSGSDYPEWQAMFADSNGKAIAALSEVAGIEVLASVGEGNVEQYEGVAGPNVHVVDRAAQPEALREAALFLGHAGFGSLREAIEAGIPTVWLPNSTDQPDNAERLAAQGLGVAIDWRTATSDDIRDAITYVLDHREEFADRVAAIRDLTHELPSLVTVTDAIGEALEMGDPALGAVHELRGLARELPAAPDAPGAPEELGEPGQDPAGDPGQDPGRDTGGDPGANPGEDEDPGAPLGPTPGPGTTGPGTGAAADVPDAPGANLGREQLSPAGDNLGQEPAADPDDSGSTSDDLIVLEPVGEMADSAVGSPANRAPAPDILEMLLAPETGRRGGLHIMPGVRLDDSPADVGEVPDGPAAARDLDDAPASSVELADGPVTVTEPPAPEPEPATVCRRPGEF